MSVVRLFEGPIFGLPNAVNELVQIFTSLKRIEKFLFAKEINSGHVSARCEREDNAVEITDGDFYFKREEKEKKEDKKDEKKGKDKEKEKKPKKDEK